MNNLSSITKKISNSDPEVLVYYSSKLLAGFFNGGTIQIGDEYIHES